MNKTNFIILALMFCNLLFAGEDSLYEVNRTSDTAIINQEMFAALGVEDEGENINGPTVIRVPDWISLDHRADSTANYYLYFAHHDGEYIRMAWAAEIEGPWHLYHIGGDVQRGERGVLDNGGKDINLDHGLSIKFNHLASPDAFVDDQNKRIILYFHSGPSTYVDDEKVSISQVTWVATSPYGLDFYDNIHSVFLGPSYFRVFDYDHNKYALTNDGTPYKAPSITTPWTAPSAYDYSKKLWDKHPKNPFQLDINNTGLTSNDLRVRHTAVRVVGDELHVFYSRRGDAPERIQYSTIDLSVGDWEDWDATFPAVELMQAQEGWEGGQYKIEASETASAPENVNQLRDPYVFQDENDSLYLFYTGCGEDAIGVAHLIYNDPLANALDEETSELPVTFYPNPTHDVLCLKNSSQQSCSYILYGMNGHVLLHAEGSANTTTALDVSQIKKGICLLSIQSKGNVVRHKIFVDGIVCK